MKTANMSLETAKALYDQGGAAKQLALDTYTEAELTKKELPKAWEELEGIKGWFVDDFSEVCDYESEKLRKSNKNIFATEEQAQAAIALAQLSQLKKVYCGDWVPDWTEDDEKYCIGYYNDQLKDPRFISKNHFLAFPTTELRDKFLANFRDLIEQAKPLMS